MKRLWLIVCCCICFAGMSACGTGQTQTKEESQLEIEAETESLLTDKTVETADDKKTEAVDEEQDFAEAETESAEEEMRYRFYELFYEGLSMEQIEARAAERSSYYRASGYYEEMTDFWENVMEVRDITYRIEPLLYADMRYYTEEDFRGTPLLVIHLAKNEIYAKHGYIFKNEDLNNYFMGCAWYEPLYTSDEFDDSVFNDYEKKNLELLSKLDVESTSQNTDMQEEKMDVEAAWKHLKEMYFKTTEMEEIQSNENGELQVVIGRTEMAFSEDDIERPCESVVFYDGEEDSDYIFGHYYVFYTEDGQEVYATKTKGWYKVDFYTGEVICAE